MPKIPADIMAENNMPSEPRIAMVDVSPSKIAWNVSLKRKNKEDFV